jgi:hypothetical protein
LIYTSLAVQQDSPGELKMNFEYKVF